MSGLEGLSGNILLGQSITGFDPSETSGVITLNPCIARLIVVAVADVPSLRCNRSLEEAAA
jgi:hypothetical protein